MYISRRGARLRNVLVSVFNGSVTLVILLIAPLGLMAVIINTLLVLSLLILFPRWQIGLLLGWNLNRMQS